MRLVRFELKKLFALRAPLILCALLCLVCAVIAGTEAKKAEKISDGTRREFYALYERDPEKMAAHYEKMKAFSVEQEELAMKAASVGSDYANVPWTNVYTDEGGGDWELFGELTSRIRFNETGYRARIEDVCAKSKTALRQMAGEKMSYAARYQYRILDLYGDLPDRVELKLSYPTGWAEWFDADGRLLFLCAGILILAVGIYGYDGGAREILAVTKYGARRTSLAKLAALFIAAALFALAMCLSALAGIAVGAGGIGDPSNVLQSVKGLELFAYPLSILSAFILSLVFALVGSAGLAFLCAVVCSASKNAVVGAAGGAVIIGTLFGLKALGGAAGRINPLSFISGAVFFDRYRAVSFFGYPLSETAAAALILLALAAAGFFATLFATDGVSRRIAELLTRPEKEGKKAKVRKHRAPRPLGAGLFRFELIKLFKQGGAVICTAVLVGISLFTLRTQTLPEDSLRERIYRDYCLEYAGEATPEKLERISAECEEFEEIIAAEKKNQLLYEQGELTPDEYRHYLNELYRAQTRIESAGVIRNRLERLLDTDGRIFYDSGVRLLAETPGRIALYIAAVFIGIFAMMKESEDTAGLIRTSRGFVRVILAKLAAVGFLCAILALLDSAAETLFVLTSFGGFDASAPLYSLDGFARETPLWLCVGIKALMNCLGLCAAGPAAFAVFALTRRSAAAALAVCVPLGLPVILRLAGASPGPDLTAAFKVYLANGAPTALICWIAAALVLCAACLWRLNKLPSGKGAGTWN